MAQERLAASFMPFNYLEYERAKCVAKVKYGVTVYKYCKNSRPHFVRLFLHERSQHLLQWISVTKGFIKTMLQIREITRIELGQSGLKFKHHTRADWADLSVSIYYCAGESLDLVFASVADMRVWLSGLAYIYDDIVAKEKYGNYREYIRITHEWIFADRDGNNELDFDEIKELMMRCNININQRALRIAFDEVDDNHNGVLDFDEFLVLNERMNYKRELEKAFTFYSQQNRLASMPSRLNRVINKEKFKQFLEEEQGEGTDTGDGHAVSLAEVESIFQSYQSPSDLRFLGNSEYMTQSGFRKYIFSLTDNVAIRGLAPNEDEMKHPFHHYYLFSTHNTYLTGHQLKSDSRAEQYSVALSAGARFVEIDCWNGPGGEPMVTHGKTLCSTVPFRDVISCIAQSAFTESPFPVIVTFEVHCSLDQQETMAAILHEKFGKNIYVPDARDGVLPSPWELRGKFLLRGKVPAHGSTSIEVQTEVVGHNTLEAVTERHIVEVSPSLYNLYAIQNTRFSIETRSPMDMSTVSEKKFLGIVKKYGAARIAEYCKDNMVRVTPSNLRIDSSNIIPTPFWSVGVQAPAFNIQTPDEGMSVAMGMFMSRGGQKGGYVLKPAYLTDPSVPYSQHAPESSQPKLRLTVTVKSGQYLPKPKGSERGEIIDPFVKVTLYGSQIDTTEAKETKEVTDNGYNPIWEETFDFELRAPELAVLHLMVMDQDPVGADFICQNSLAVTEIRKGMRVVPMYDFNNRIMAHTCLLCEFKLTPL